jgi:hypothetical protein
MGAGSYKKVPRKTNAAMKFDPAINARGIFRLFVMPYMPQHKEILESKNNPR